MRLVDLNPVWVGHGGEGVTVTATGAPVPRREAVGIEFDCPCGCVHRVYVSFANPVDGLGPVYAAGNNWQRTGDTFDTLTLSPSIQRILPNKCWHGHVTNGEVTNA
jgi:hypothetical protein